MGKGLEQTLLQRRYMNGQQAHEKMLSFTNHQGNPNQNCKEIPSYTHLDGYYQKTDKQTKPREQQAPARMWRSQNPVPCWWEHKIVQPLWKTVWWFLKIFKYNYLMIQRFHFRVYTQRIESQGLKEVSVHPCSQQHFSQQLKCGNNQVSINR